MAISSSTGDAFFPEPDPVLGSELMGTGVAVGPEVGVAVGGSGVAWITRWTVVCSPAMTLVCWAARTWCSADRTETVAVPGSTLLNETPDPLGS